MSFQIHGLPAQAFSDLFALSDAELAARNIRRTIVNEPNHAPCRVSLLDAEPGETVLLLPYPHLTVATPYRSSGPIYVRCHATTAQLALDTVPDQLQRRLLSVRAYDAAGWMVEADVTPGTELTSLITRFWANTEIAFLQVHYARTGCFACQIERG